MAANIDPFYGRNIMTWAQHGVVNVMVSTWHNESLSGTYAKRQDTTVPYHNLLFALPTRAIPFSQHPWQRGMRRMAISWRCTHLNKQCVRLVQQRLSHIHSGCWVRILIRPADPPLWIRSHIMQQHLSPIRLQLYHRPSLGNARTRYCWSVTGHCEHHNTTTSMP
jgi:hypothetical protein